MSYQTIYDRLIERSRGRKLSGYRERHHILPRCLKIDPAGDTYVPQWKDSILLPKAA